MAGKIIRLKGAVVRNFFAASILDEYGIDEARDRCTGPMLEAVEAEWERRKQEAVWPPITSAEGETR